MQKVVIFSCLGYIDLMDWQGGNVAKFEDSIYSNNKYHHLFSLYQSTLWDWAVVYISAWVRQIDDTPYLVKLFNSQEKHMVNNM